MSEPEPTAYEPSRDPPEQNPILLLLERWGWTAIPKGAIPPPDPDLGSAREEAARIATATGRSERVADVVRRVREHVLHDYDQVAFGYTWFVGSNDPVGRRLEIIELLSDSAVAYELYDVLGSEATVVLLARLDVYLAGPLFREPAAPTSATGDEVD